MRYDWVSAAIVRHALCGLVLVCVLAPGASAQDSPEALAPGAVAALPVVSASAPHAVASGLSASGAHIAGVGKPVDLFSSEWPPEAWPSFRWTSGGGYEIIAVPDSLGLVAIGAGTAISADGAVVVGTFTLADPDPLKATMRDRAFRWTSRDGLAWLPAPEAAVTRAYAASEDGAVILGDIWPLAPEAPRTPPHDSIALGMPGSAIPPPTSSGRRPPRQQVLWRGDSTMVIPPPSGYERILSRDLSGDGTVVVGTGFSAGARGFDRAAFRWTAKTGSHLIPGLEDYSKSEASAVSADGRVVVGYAYDGSLENLAVASAFRWSEEDGLEWLGTWTARDVSADGSTIVGSYRTASAVIWTPEAGARYARDVFAADGWWLMGIDAVSADGSIVIGGGEAPDGTETSWRGWVPRE